MATYTKVYNNPYPDGWKDGKDGNTPVTADILNNQTETLESIEQYLADNPIEQGGGSSGTTDYEALENKPTINGVEVVGDLSLEDLGITGGGGTGTTNYEDLTNKPSINGTELSGDITLDIPTKTSDLTNDSGFLTEIPEQSYNDLADKPKINGIDLQGNLTVEELGLLDITESTDTTLENSKAGVLKIKEIYGNTEQYTTSGKNQLDCNGLTTQTINGVTFTPVYADNGELEYVNVNGTATAMCLLEIGSIYLIANQSYVLTGELLTLRSADGGTVYAETGKTYTPTADITVYCKLRVGSGETKSNVKVYPMVRLASITDATYEPYTNGASPNPDYPQEIESVVISEMNTTNSDGILESVATLSEPITLNGLNGVQDYVDVKRGVLVQKFGSVTYDGTESNWNKMTIGSISRDVFYIPLNDYNTNGELNYISNILRAIPIDDRYSEPNTFVIGSNSWIVCYPSDFTTLDEWKAHLASKPMTVVYELAEPIETPLPEADVEALKSLKTYDGVTHIFTDSEVAPSWLLEYNTTRVGTELDEIDAELVKINKRITDIGTTAQINYSTEEQVVGTWIDGRPIYQKSYSAKPNVGESALLDSEIIHPTHILLDVKGTWAIGEYAMLGGAQTSIFSSFYWDSTDIQPPKIQLDEDGLRVRPSNVTYGFEIKATVQYTKTTDTV